MSTRRIRILIAEDDSMIASLLSETLSGMGYDVCGQVDSEEALFRNGLELKPDLMLVDVGLGSGSGVLAIKRLTGAIGHIPHIFITGNLEAAKILETISTILRKPFKSIDLAQAIQDLRLNEVQNKKALEMWPELSGRQHQVLLLLAQGKSNQQISEEMGITEATIKVSVSQIIRILQVENRTQAALLVAQRSSFPARVNCVASCPVAVSSDKTRLLLRNLLDLISNLDIKGELPIEVVAAEAFLLKKN